MLRTSTPVSNTVPLRCNGPKRPWIPKRASRSHVVSRRPPSPLQFSRRENTMHRRRRSLSSECRDKEERKHHKLSAVSDQASANVLRGVLNTEPEGVPATLSSEHPALLPDKLQHIVAANPECSTHVWNFQSHWITCRRFLRHNITTLNPSKDDHKRICSQPRSGRVHTPLVNSKNFLHSKLNGLVGRNEHRPALACPFVNLIVQSL